MENRQWISGFFYRGATPLKNGPRIGMSLRSAGSMRFRWNEDNPNRTAFLKTLCSIPASWDAPDAGKFLMQKPNWWRLSPGENPPEQSVRAYSIAQVELIHSKTVYAVEEASELEGLQGDGIITCNRNLIPVVTVADCMPVYLYEPETGVFGMLHSGWKGTGIVCNAVELAEKKYGANRRNFCVVMGPHIHDCCYSVDEERAQYFRVNFTADCVKPLQSGGAMSASKMFSLSLARANLAALKDFGVPESNIVEYKDCTCCNEVFGSFRRETAGLPADMSLEERQRHFTVQAAWVKW